MGVKGWSSGRLDGAGAWLPKANPIWHEMVESLLIQAKDLIAAVAAS